MDLLAQQLQKDLQDIELDSDFMKLLEPGEKILAHIPILFKFNGYRNRQSRGMVITNQSILNLKKSSLKRRIPIKAVKAISISTLAYEFVLHVPEEYDYRFLSLDKRNVIIVTILKSYFGILKKKMPIYFKEEQSLVNYTTTKKDKKLHISRMPTDEPQLMDDKNFLQIIDVKEEKSLYQTRYDILFSRDNQKDITFDDFLILRVLGANFLGKVMLVEHKDTAEWFVLKSIRKDEIKLNPLEEITYVDKQINAHLNTPFVEQLAFCISSKHKYFFYTQFMRGGVLSSLIKNSEFDEEKLKFYAACLTLGIGAIHAQGFVFKNLQPQAIMMDDHGYLLLVDFHWVRFSLLNEHLLRTQYYQYISPENLNDECEEYKKPHDWWSLGVIIYEMLYKMTPYQGSNPSQVLSNIMDKQLQFDGVISDACKSFISNKQPEKRLGFKDDFGSVMQHPWFKDIDWKLLYNKQQQAPTKPNLEGEKWIDNEVK